MPKPSLSSRQRVIKTIQHQEPDRVPFDLSLTVDIYHRLRQHLGLPLEPDKAVGHWTDVSLSLDLVEAMQVDILTIGLNPPAHPKQLDRGDGLLYDEWGIGRTKVSRDDDSYYYEMVYHPLASASLEQVLDHPWPDPYDPGRVAGLREKVERLRSDTDKAVMAKFANSIWEQSWWLYGLQSWMIDLAVNPQAPTAILDKVTDLAIGFATVGLEVVGDMIDIYRLSGEDLGTQLAPMISPRMYQQHVQPRFERFWRAVKTLLLKKNPEGKIMLHSCGNVRPFIPSWIEIGLDILNPIQPRAAGMEPAGLKRDFGQSLSFHGGVDIQHTLPFGTTEEVAAEVQRYIKALAPGGGYVVAPAHNVQSDVPSKNLVAIRDAIDAYGYYPIKL